MLPDLSFSLPDFFSLVLWQLVLLYTFPVGYWLYEIALHFANASPTNDDPVEWGAADVHVRILTVDAEEVVQETVDALPAEFDDVLVVAEADITVESDVCDVEVVPSEFECRASAKGRALEWARRVHPTDREYVLYLDEDTLVPTFPGLPDADIVQFRERPIRTDSLLSYLAEIHRIGFNLEQLAFEHLDVPLYAWGGGIAVRSDLEDRVTWDVETMVEDSVFAWRALLDHDATYHLSRTYFENQAPPSIWAMINQRRRWLTGTRTQSEVLPYDYQVLYNIRDIGWAVSVFAPVVWFLSLFAVAGVVDVPTQQVLLPQVYYPLSYTLLGFVYLWSVLGLYYYRAHPLVWALLLALTPLVVLVHSIGALWGFVAPADGFTVTEKVSHSDGDGTPEDAEGVT